MLKGSLRQIWKKTLSNEWGRLTQKNRYGMRSTDTIKFTHKHAVPKNQDVTYATYVLDYRPLKNESSRVRITVGGNRLACYDDTGSHAANLLEIKVLLNTTISDAERGARIITTDINDYFLATPMEKSEYMKVKSKHILDDIKQRYNLC